VKIRAQDAEYLLNCIAHFKLISEEIDAATNTPSNTELSPAGRCYIEGIIEGLDIAANIIKGKYNGNAD